MAAAKLLLTSILVSALLSTLTTPGRLTKLTLDPVSSSDGRNSDTWRHKYAPARAMTVEEIKDVIDRFGYGAKVLYKAGADGMQLHA